MTESLILMTEESLILMTVTGSLIGVLLTGEHCEHAALLMSCSTS